MTAQYFKIEREMMKQKTYIETISSRGKKLELLDSWEEIRGLEYACHVLAHLQTSLTVTIGDKMISK